jgi:hypothetical protein
MDKENKTSKRMFGITMDKENHTSKRMFGTTDRTCFSHEAEAFCLSTL